jgi:hypothetical protein
MHQTVGNLLRVLCHSHPPQNTTDANALVDEALAIASYALRATINRTIGATPGAIVFNRDMLLDIPYIADLVLLRNKRQQIIDYNLRHANNQRHNYDYQVGGQVYELVSHRNRFTGTLSTRTDGPYRIIQVHTNGTLTIQRNNNLIDRINIRRLRPVIV